VRRAAWLGLALVLLAGTALAVGPARDRRMGLVWNSTHLTVSFRFDDLFDRAVRSRVDKCLKTTILATLRAHRADDPEAAVGGSARTCEVTRDVWDEFYHTSIFDRSGSRREVVRTFGEVVALCADVRGMPVARRGAFRSGRGYRVSATLEVNPLSRESVRRIQRWLRSPEPTSRGESGSSVFGSVTSLFVRPRIGQAERTLLLRSQSFTAP